ncbi:predicted protein [Nematostella vectensis]|uniref:Malectin domain-containing protein n=1 Tax=Nematostella vectensis TaxID=45351 RepID=A7RLY6_NEMVE|nr:predicted protein [Nematostella vectensis]|eukprot:XP_001639476.1 predicted protein [Nematostella vectensis]
MDNLVCELIFVLVIGVFSGEVWSTGEVVYAVNSGGPAHTDLNGVHYQADKLTVGVSSDYGKMLTIGRVAPPDQILYQTERYHLSNFGYTVPIKENGEYVLVLKFCEVYFQAPRLKVFDVSINSHPVIQGLDIYEKVGRGIAHDEYVPFTIRDNQLIHNGNTMPFTGTVYVEFIKGVYDNPKINAMLIMKGTLEDVPKLPALPGPQDEEEEKEEAEDTFKEEKPKKQRKTSGPKAVDPYANDILQLFIYNLSLNIIPK